MELFVKNYLPVTQYFESETLISIKRHQSDLFLEYQLSVKKNRSSETNKLNTKIKRKINND